MRPSTSSTALAPTGHSIFIESGKDRYFTVTSTTVGELLLVGDGASLVELRLPSFGPWEDLPDDYIEDAALFDNTSQEIGAYFAGELTTFTVPLAPTGTPFQLSVWQALLAIEYGKTASYGEIATSIGRPKAPRAVGMANHVNPIALIIPCHRVIGANGSLTGYGGGLPLKERLLDLESAVIAGKRPS